MIINALFLASICYVVFLLNVDSYITVLIAAFLGVLLIVFGERGNAESKWEAFGLPGREFFLPLALLSIFCVQGIIDPTLVEMVTKEKAPILALILSFAVVSNGFSRCGFFEWAAYRIVEKCAGDTKRLIIYMFILSSIMTFFTSNDIVVLTLTPIIFSICVFARIPNAKLLFLSQFVAANTLAMGLLIGSPTNIIVGDALRISFMEYLFLMVIPAIFSFFLTLVMVEKINNWSKVGNAFTEWMSWEFHDNYRIPARSPHPELTGSMRNWLFVFVVGVVALIAATAFGWSLYIPSIILVILSGFTVIYETVILGEKEPGQSRGQSVGMVLFSLPYGIIGFALAYFTFARFISESDMLLQITVWFFDLAERNPLAAGPAIVGATGLMVNTLNDLPAAAVVSEMLTMDTVALPEAASDLAKAQAAISTDFTRLAERTQNIVFQAVMVGLNIGCYVTPVGALAGIIWFNQMRTEERRFQKRHGASGALDSTETNGHVLKTPTRVDLVVYGTVIFVVSSVMIGLFLPFFSLLIEMLAVPVARLSEFGSTFGSSAQAVVAVVGSLIILIIYRQASNLVRKNQVAIGHISEVFVILNRLAIWSYKHRFVYTISIFLLLLTFSGALVQWIERISVDIYGSGLRGESLVLSVPSSLVQYYLWYFVFVGSTFEQGFFPQSLLANVLMGIMPLAGIAAALQIIRSTSRESLSTLRERMGTGDIPNDRILLVNLPPRLSPLIEKILDNSSAFVVVVTREKNFNRLALFAENLMEESIHANRVLVRQLDVDPYSTLRELNFWSAKEIYFFSDFSLQSEIENLKMLSRIDAWINEQRVAAGLEIQQLEDKTHEELDSANFGEFLGLPKIFFEVGNEREAIRVRGTMSDVLKYQSYVTSFSDIVAMQLVANCFGDIIQLNKALGFHSGQNTKHAKQFSLFGADSDLLSGIRLRDVSLGGAAIQRLRSFFRDHFDQQSLKGSSLRSHSYVVRNQMPKLIESLGHLDDEGFGDKSGAGSDFHELVGLRCDVGGRKYRLDFAAACTSNQSVTADAFISIGSGNEDTVIEQPSVGNHTLFFFNFNPIAEELLTRLINSAEFDKLRAVVLLGQGQSIDSSLTTYPNVVVRTRESVNEAIQLVINGNTGETEGSANTPGYKNFTVGEDDFEGLRAGDSVLVFTDYEDEQTSNLEIVQFIEDLDFRLQSADLAGIRPHTEEFFTAVEASDEETRFLFEHLSIDEFIDTMELRNSFFNQFLDLFHVAANGKLLDTGSRSIGLGHSALPTRSVFNFRRSCFAADYFKALRIVMAREVELVDQFGVKCGVVGLSIEEARSLFLTRSNPGMQLLLVIQLDVSYVKSGWSPTFKEVISDLDYEIQTGDALVLLPAL